MCGINGVYFYDRDAAKKCNLDKQLKEMNDLIKHRGPDDNGVFYDEIAGIGMQRLSIIDLGSGHQPIFNEDGSKSIIFNGEIYNYLELKKALTERGHKFTTESDTEVLLHGYEEYGTDLFEMLSGMFAICIYDLENQEMVIARDRAGQKPLYYYSDKEKLIFASELKSIINVWGIEKKINIKALNLYLGLTYIPAPYTIYEGIKKLEAGMYGIISSTGITVKEYWRLNPVRSHKNYVESKNELYKMLENSVRHQMISDVPIGAFLSGGIDSSIIVGMMSRISGSPIETFSIGFNSKDFDESSKATTVAEFNHTNHHTKILDYNNALTFMDSILEALDEPFADSSAIPTYYVSQFASEYVKVVLTGDAGDELFGGYSKYLIGYYSDIYNRVPGWIRKVFFEPLIKMLPDNDSRIRKIKKVINNAGEEAFPQYLNLMKLGIKDLNILLTNDYYDSAAFEDIRMKYYQKNIPEGLQKSLYSDFKIVLEGDMLVKVDRMSMLNSLETRVPLLDEKIIDFAFSLPDHFKINQRNQKRILKDTFRGLLPHGILKKGKQGFGVPVGDWFRGPLKNCLYDQLSKEKITAQGIFKYEYIKQLLDEHMTLKENRAFELWTLFVFQNWYDKYFLQTKTNNLQ